MTMLAASTSSIGAVSGTGVSVAEYGDNSFIHQTTLTLLDAPLTLSDTNQGAGVKVYTFPVGMVTILGGLGVITETTTSTLASSLNSSVTYNWGVGTVTQSHGTLLTTEQDIIPTTNGTASATINIAGVASYAHRTDAPVIFDGRSSAKELYVNVGIATGTDIDGNATSTWSGTIIILWAYTGTA